jgi:hypothetical protein
LDPALHKRFSAVRTAMRRRFPTANELVYDYRSFVVISYSPNEQPLDALAAISTRDGEVSVYLMSAKSLPDPRRLLQGSGKLARFFRVESARELADPYVESLFAAVVAAAKVPLAPTGKGRLLLRAGAAKAAPASAAKPKPKAARKAASSRRSKS